MPAIVRPRRRVARLIDPVKLSAGRVRHSQIVAREMSKDRAPAARRSSNVASSMAWPRQRRYSIVARCRPSSVLTATGKGSNARARELAAPDRPEQRDQSTDALPRHRRSCRGRSPILARRAEVGQDLPKLGHGLARRRGVTDDDRRRYPPLANCLGEHGIGKYRASSRPRRNKLGYDPISIGDQHDLAGGSQADIFAELVLNVLRPTARMRTKSATGSY